MAGGSLLVILFILEHVKRLGCQGPRVRSVTLPLAASIAFGLEKVFNAEVGFMQPPADLEALVVHPRWAAMWIAVGFLGLADLYLNMRAFRVMKVQVYVPIAFALVTSLQFFQSVVVFKEFKYLGIARATLSVVGTCLALVGALLCRPARALHGRDLPPKLDQCQSLQVAAQSLYRSGGGAEKLLPDPQDGPELPCHNEPMAAAGVSAASGSAGAEDVVESAGSGGGGTGALAC
jgi:hypothetical protein